MNLGNTCKVSGEEDMICSAVFAMLKFNLLNGHLGELKTSQILDNNEILLSNHRLVGKCNTKISILGKSILKISALKSQCCNLSYENINIDIKNLKNQF